MHPLADLKVPSGAVAIHWFEQSSYAIKDEHGTVVLIDPYFPHDRPADRFIHPTPPLDEATLPTDYVLLTHDHGDHTWPESLERIWQNFPQAVFVGPTESVRRMQNETTIAADHQITLYAGMGVNLDSMVAYAVYAKPPYGDPDAGIQPPDVTHLGYIVKAGARTLYFTGDVINTFAELDAVVLPVAAFKPEIGFLTNHPSEGEFPFFAGSAKMAEKIGLKHAVPAHYQCFVKRNYDPKEWAAHFFEGGPKPLIIPHNSHIIYTGA